MRQSITLSGLSAVLILASVIVTPLAAAATPIPQAAHVEIHVQAGQWGAATTGDIETVLTSVATELLQFFPDKQLSPIRVVADASGPRVFFDRDTKGEYLVFLSVKDARWDQFTYQFSHELCHILSNHDHKDMTDHGVARDNQWFEESVCESASIMTLQRMALRWEQSPPYPQWRGYAPAFREYAANLLNQPHRELTAGVTLAGWYQQNQISLRSDPYLRDKTELVANALLEIFERDPQSLSAIAYLNEEKSATSGSFKDYLTSWRSCCPRTQQNIVRQTMALFGMSDNEAYPNLLLARYSGAGTGGK